MIQQRQDLLFLPCQLLLLTTDPTFSPIITSITILTTNDNDLSGLEIPINPCAYYGSIPCCPDISTRHSATTTLVSVILISSLVVLHILIAHFLNLFAVLMRRQYGCSILPLFRVSQPCRCLLYLRYSLLVFIMYYKIMKICWLNKVIIPSQSKSGLTSPYLFLEVNIRIAYVCCSKNILEAASRPKSCNP